MRSAVFATLIPWVLYPMTSWAGEPASGAFDLQWTAGDGCPDQAAAETAIRKILGPRVTTGGKSDPVQVEISALADGQWEARILTRGTLGSGERRFVGPTCSRVADAAVLVVAMTLDPVPIAERVTVMRETARRATPSPMQTPARDQARMVAGLRAVADVGSLPGLASGLGVVLGLQYGRLRLEGDATAWLPRVVLVQPTDSGGEIGLYSGGLRGCWEGVQSASGELRVGGCLDGEAGVTTGQGTIGIAQRRETSGLWLAAFAGLTVRQVSASGLSSWLSLDIGTPIRRPMYVIDNGSSPVLVFQASEVVGRAALGLAWIFP